MSQISLVAKITFKDCIRTKGLYGIFLLGIILFAANIIFTGMFSFEIGKMAVDMGLSVISFSGLIFIFFFSIQSFFNDFEKKTIYMIISRPISKAEYIIGKFSGLGLVILFSSLVLGLCAAISFKLSVMGHEAYIPQHFTWSFFFISILFLTLSLIIMLGISVLWTCATSHQFIGFLLSLMTYFIGHNMETVKNMILSTKIFPPDALPIKTINLVSWILPNLAVFDLKTQAAYGLMPDVISLMWIALYGLSYIGLCLIISIWIFNRRELA